MSTPRPKKCVYCLLEQKTFWLPEDPKQEWYHYRDVHKLRYGYHNVNVKRNKPTKTQWVGKKGTLL